MSSGSTAVRVARALPGLLREVRDGAAAAPPLALAGPPSAVGELARALCRDGEPALVRQVGVDWATNASPLQEGGIEGAALVYVINGDMTPTDERVLREADHRRVPLVCLVVGGGDERVLPYVPATDVIRAGAVDGDAVAAVAKRVAARAGEAAWGLARGLPVLRRPVAQALVRRYARQNAAVGAAVFVPGADLPVLTLNQLRMVLRIAAAYGVELAGARALALAGVAGAGLGLRALARRAAGLAAFPSFALKGAVAYGGTLALGEATIAFLER